MGKENSFNKAKLFCGFIYNQKDLYEKTKIELEKRYSSIDYESEEFNFDKTDYYNAEMGSGLNKRFVSFIQLITVEELPEIKLFTNSLEDQSKIKGNRQINIDPGYLSNANVIIATTKNHYHRVPLSRGIYAHMEYVLKKKIIPLDWTYPDFRTEKYIEFFYRLREIYNQNVKTTD